MKCMYWFAIALLGTVLIGCDKEAAPSTDRPADSTPTKSEAGYISGRVLGENGKPIEVAQEILVFISGISEAGEKVNYSPAVKPDGTYRQKVVPGSYRFNRSIVKVMYEGDEFSFYLVPQGDAHNKNRDAADGIAQDFVWKVTGPTNEGKTDPNNHTHWHGMSIGIRQSGYRDDVKQSTVAPPTGTKMTFTLKPLGKSIDGRELKETTIERQWTADLITPIDDINDLPPASYEIAGVATLPDGTTKPLLLQGTGDYPNYKPVTKAMLDKDNITGGMFKPEISFVIE